MFSTFLWSRMDRHYTTQTSFDIYLCDVWLMEVSEPWKQSFLIWRQTVMLFELNPDAVRVWWWQGMMDKLYDTTICNIRKSPLLVFMLFGCTLPFSFPLYYNFGTMFRSVKILANRHLKQIAPSHMTTMEVGEFFNLHHYAVSCCLLTTKSTGHVFHDVVDLTMINRCSLDCPNFVHIVYDKL